MNLNKFIFIRDILQSPEWHDEVVSLDDAKQQEYLESLYVEYKDKYVKHNYNTLQFFEEYLQIKYSQKD